MLRIYCILLVTATAGAEIPRALPVDPSRITPPAIDQPAPEPPPVARPVVAEPAPAVPSSAALAPEGDEAVRLQIFLDEAGFGPGVIDGKPGRFTRLAAQTWNEAHGHPGDDFEALMSAARAAVPHIHAVATVPELATEWVDPELPYKRSKQRDAKRMSYRSHAEFMAERYHADVDFLVELNGVEVVRKLAPKDAIRVPNVTPFRIEALTGARHETEATLAARHVVVDTGLNQARVYEAAPRARMVGAEASPNRGLVAAFPITPGQERFIKYGQWELRNAVENPYWRYDQSLLDGKGRSEQAFNLPPGPNSPVGVIWMGLSVSGIGIHGTSSPETIGRSRSAGCIRMANWDAIRLPQLVRPGASVEIR